jgi:hypothetical protein
MESYEQARDGSTQHRVFALVWSLDWAPAEAGDRHASGLLDWCRTQSRVLPLHVPEDF